VCVLLLGVSHGPSLGGRSDGLCEAVGRGTQHIGINQYRAYPGRMHSLAGTALHREIRDEEQPAISLYLCVSSLWFSSRCMLRLLETKHSSTTNQYRTFSSLSSCTEDVRFQSIAQLLQESKTLFLSNMVKENAGSGRALI